MCQGTSPKDETKELHGKYNAYILPNWNVGLCFLVSQSHTFQNELQKDFTNFLIEPTFPEKLIESLLYLVNLK